MLRAGRGLLKRRVPAPNAAGHSGGGTNLFSLLYRIPKEKAKARLKEPCDARIIKTAGACARRP